MKAEYDAAEFLDNVSLGHSEQERQLARNWINTAAQESRNKEYYKAERDKLGRLLLEIEKKCHDVCVCCGFVGYGICHAENNCQLYLECRNLEKLLND